MPICICIFIESDTSYDVIVHVDSSSQFASELRGDDYLTHAHLLFISFHLSLNLFCLTCSTRRINADDPSVLQCTGTSLQLLNPYNEENSSLILFARQTVTGTNSETGHYESIQLNPNHITFNSNLAKEREHSERIAVWEPTDPMTQVHGHYNYSVHARAFFYSPYASTLNIMHSLILHHCVLLSSRLNIHLYYPLCTLKFPYALSNSIVNQALRVLVGNLPTPPVNSDLGSISSLHYLARVAAFENRIKSRTAMKNQYDKGKQIHTFVLDDIVGVMVPVEDRISFGPSNVPGRIVKCHENAMYIILTKYGIIERMIGVRQLIYLPVEHYAFLKIIPYNNDSESQSDPVFGGATESETVTQCDVTSNPHLKKKPLRTIYREFVDDPAPFTASKIQLV
jgi:hypothetical protein